MKKNQILLVEDDKNLAFIIQDNLNNAGFSCHWAQNGEEAIEAIKNSIFDVVLSDVSMPKVDGYNLAKWMRANKISCPIIFVSAREQKHDRIKGFEVGGDDYITKPFSIEELILRIKAILRRTSIGIQEDCSVRQIGSYQFFPNDFELKISDETIKLTYLESNLLDYFIQHPNQILERDVLLMHVWGNSDYYKGRSMDVFISRLRKHLSKDENILIENIHGHGFRLRVKGE